MPFINQIVTYINDSLKAGSLNKSALQPAVYHELSTVVVRKNATQKEPEYLPAIISPEGKAMVITPDSKLAIQIYHKQLTNVYSYEKKSYGNNYDVKSSTELAMIVITNSKLIGSNKDAVEPLFVFGIPQVPTQSFLQQLNIINCSITPLGSNMNHVEVFRQEYPKSDYFLNEQMSMFLIRYRIEMKFNQACVDQCLCQ
jgi:hypothetical protein